MNFSFKQEKNCEKFCNFAPKNYQTKYSHKTNQIMTQEKTMDIKAVKFRKDGFYSQPFAFGGEEGHDTA